MNEKTQERDQTNFVMHMCVCLVLFEYFFASMFVFIYLADKDKVFFTEIKKISIVSVYVFEYCVCYCNHGLPADSNH